jgi:hypothetical protein
MRAEVKMAVVEPHNCALCAFSDLQARGATVRRVVACAMVHGMAADDFTVCLCEPCVAVFTKALEDGNRAVRESNVRRGAWLDPGKEN